MTDQQNIDAKIKAPLRNPGPVQTEPLRQLQKERGFKTLRTSKAFRNQIGGSDSGEPLYDVPLW